MTSGSESVRQISPTILDQLSKLYAILDSNIHSNHRKGIALTSLDAFCDAFLVIRADGKDYARIKIAEMLGGEVWIGFYDNMSDEDALCVEMVRLKIRAQYGTQVSRWALVGACEALSYPPEHLRFIFTGYTD